MSEQLEKVYDVYLHHQFKRIGYQVGAKWGGPVTHPNGWDVVGCIKLNPQTGEFYLSATEKWHTGKQWDGEKVSVDNRPSKEFN